MYIFLIIWYFLKSIRLEDIYNYIVKEFPSLKDKQNEKEFLASLCTVLRKYSIRTSNVINSINSNGLDFEINLDFPLNDFMRGTFEYLVDKNINSEEASKFTSKLTYNPQNIFLK